MKSEIPGILIYTISGLIAAYSQLILKKTATTSGDKGIKQYLDWRIIASYGMMFSTILLNMIAMRYIPYKYTPVLSSLSYVFVLILGKIVLHENFGRNKLIGIALILSGMIVFYV